MLTVMERGHQETASVLDLAPSLPMVFWMLGIDTI